MARTVSPDRASTKKGMSPSEFSTLTGDAIGVDITERKKMEQAILDVVAREQRQIAHEPT